MLQTSRFRTRFILLALVCTAALLWPTVRLAAQDGDAQGLRRYLYVATPGIRNYLEYGGHGLLVFDIDNDYRFVRRISTGGLNEEGNPVNVKGVCANAENDRIYISTIHALQCIDLETDKLLWEKKYPGGCDRMSMSPDGKLIYQPSFEKDHWHVIDAESGEIIARVVPRSGAHNTVYGRDGRYAYLAGLRSPLLSVADNETHAIVRQVGPFSHSIRPFTVNGRQTLCFVNVNNLLGFEIGDLKTGKMLHRVEVKGFQKGKVKRHGCPSHGIGLTPDEKEIWVTDGANSRMHIFDATSMPPVQRESIKLRDQPGWITFSLNGRHAWPSSGEIIDVKSRKIVAALTDEEGRDVGSEKMVEIHFKGDEVVATGDQFGIGRVVD